MCVLLVYHCVILFVVSETKDVPDPFSLIIYTQWTS